MNKNKTKNNNVLDHIFLWCLATFAFSAPFVVISDIFEFAQLSQSCFIQTSSVFLLVLFFIKCAIQKNIRIFKTSLYLPLFVFIIWSGLSIFWAYNRYEGVSAWMHWAACFLTFLLVAHGLRNKADALFLLKAIFLSGFCVALLGIGQHLFRITWVPQAVAPAATFANKNMAAQYIVLTLPLGMAFFIYSKDKMAVWFYAVASSLMTSFLFYTSARAGLLAFGIQILCWGLCLFSKKIRTELNEAPRVKYVATAVGVFLCMLLIHLTSSGFQWTFAKEYNRLTGDIEALSGLQNANKNSKELESAEKGTGKNTSDTSSTKRESSFSGRLVVWRNTLEMIKDYFWTGVGIGNFRVFYPVYSGKALTNKWFTQQVQVRKVHNDYIQTWSELGTIGMLIFAWGVITAGIIFFKTLHFENKYKYITFAIAVALIGCLANAFASFPIQRALPPFVIMLLLAVLLLISLKSEQIRSIKLLPWIAPIFSVISLVAAIMLYKFQTKRIECDRYYRKLVVAEKASNWNAIIQNAQRAIACNPYRQKIYYDLGKAYINAGKPGKGVNALKKVIEVYPYHINALMSMGTGYSKMRAFEKAVQAYQKVSAIKPDIPQIYNNIAKVRYHQGRIDEAFEFFRKAIVYAPENPIGYFNYGFALFDQKSYEEASNAFRKAVEFKPEWDWAYKYLGSSLLHLKKNNEAIKHYKKALQLNPKIEDHEQMKKIIQQFEK